MNANLDTLNIIQNYAVLLYIISLTCLLHSVGNFMYFSATSNYMLLGSRFIVGESWEGVIRSAGLIASVRESTLMCLVV